MDWDDIFKELEKKKSKPTILYPEKLSLKNEEAKAFQNKQKLSLPLGMWIILNSASFTYLFNAH